MSLTPKRSTICIEIKVTQAQNRKHDEKDAEPAFEHCRRKPCGEQGAERGKDERGRNEREKSRTFEKPALCVYAQRERRHGQKRDEVDALCHRLIHAEQGKQRDEHGAPAHAHAAEHAAREPAQEED